MHHEANILHHKEIDETEISVDWMISKLSGAKREEST